MELNCLKCGKPFKTTQSRPGKYCSAKCGHDDKKEKPLSQRLWSKIDVKSEDECWPWKGTLNKQGYGAIGFKDRKPKGAHRVTYQITKGDIPEGMVVMHTCDNPQCCNPKHLKLGTYSDNSEDMVSKGRGNPPKGNNNIHSKGR